MSDKLTSLKGFGEGDPKPEAKSKALSKKTGMYTSPTGSKHRYGSNKHRYWESIKRRGEDNARAGVPND